MAYGKRGRESLMNTSIPLYQLADQYLAAAHELTDLDIDEQTVIDTLEGMTGEFEEKAINVAKFIQNLRSSSAAMKLAEEKMHNRRKAVEKREQNIIDYLKLNMERCGITNINCDYFSLSIRNNPVSVVIDNQLMIPNGFMRQPEDTPLEPDKKAIADAMKSGVDIPGAHLEVFTRLDIK